MSLDREIASFLNDFAVTNNLTADAHKNVADPRKAAEAVIKSAMHLVKSNPSAAKILFADFPGTVAALGGVDAVTVAVMAPEPASPSEPVQTKPKNTKPSPKVKVEQNETSERKRNPISFEIDGFGDLTASKLRAIATDSDKMVLKSWRDGLVHLVERALAEGKPVPESYLRDTDHQFHRALSNGQYLFLNLTLPNIIKRTLTMVEVFGVPHTLSIERQSGETFDITVPL